MIHYDTKTFGTPGRCPTCNRPPAFKDEAYSSDKDRALCYEWYLRSKCGLTCSEDNYECRKKAVNWRNYALQLEQQIIQDEKEIKDLNQTIARHYRKIFSYAILATLGSD